MTKPRPLGTTHIGIRPATNALHGARYAKEIGCAPTIAVSINWDRLGIDAEEATSLFRDLRSRVRRRWKYMKQFDPTIGSLHDLGAHENPDGRRNTHWSVHVPDHVVEGFQNAVGKFLCKVAGLKSLPERAVHFQRITALGGHLKYILKGIRADAADHFYIDAIPQGFVSGRGRTFVSRSLGFTARKASGWTRKRRPPRERRTDSIQP